MTEATTQAVKTTATKARATYLVQRDARKRFSFGKVWSEAVKAGQVSDKDKLVAHAIKLKAGKRSDLCKLRFETLLAKVQKALLTTAAA